MRSLALMVLLAASCTASCKSEGRRPPPLQAASQDAAVDVVRVFLDAAKEGNAAKVAGLICRPPGPQGSEAMERASLALQGPLRIQGYDIAKVEPAWVGAEPYFRIEVLLRRDSETDPRSLSVRARQGCIDRLLGEPVVSATPPDPSEISL